METTSWPFGRIDATGRDGGADICRGILTSLSTLAPRDPTGRNNRFRALLGYTTKAWTEGYGEVELHLREDHQNSMGIVHGGVYVTLLDGAMGHATSWCAVPGNVRSAVTVSLTTSFLASVKSGTLIARARVEHQEGRNVTLTGEVVSEDGTILATGQASFYYLPGNEHRDGVPRRG